jgi:hypothetical protein
MAQSDRPRWFDDSNRFCAELAARANGRGKQSSVARGGPPPFDRYRIEPIRSPRKEEAVLGKYDWTNHRKFIRQVREEAAKGPDFAGRYALILWSCGSWCANAIFADVLTGARHDVPFLGVGGCRTVTGDHDTMERRADSRLMVVRGSLEMTYGSEFSEGPCGTFSFVWENQSLRLLTCEIPEK